MHKSYCLYLLSIYLLSVVSAAYTPHVSSLDPNTYSNVEDI